MEFNDVRFGMSSSNLGVLIFTGLTSPTKEIREFIKICSLPGEFKFVKTITGLGIICPDLKQQMHLYFEAGEYWRITISKLDSPVEILEFMKL